ncbi:reverse transcriptase family protein [Aliivibrio logei]|uniref:RNA-directed DNA polymerase n=1 Tax=Aliivibrio logei TaxID=688 RepID=A0A1B9NZP1_ALILO|nr:reverse transcriptase family protein [Aliivibrio logei]OCH21580.1 RNA-dependent DNA polymerase [Aliivibrio logei]
MNSKKTEQVVNEWKFYFLDRGISDHLIPQYLSYVEKLTNQQLPIIFEVEHLSVLIGIEYGELNKMVHDSSKFYREFEIPKRSGGKRCISAPYPSLLMCQDWIYNNILKSRNLHFCAHAYRTKKSIVTNAKKHLGKNALLKMDMQDFFPSIPINWIVNFFSGLGYSDNVAYSLASLCCLNDGLPQGASTSPALSNILLVSLDSRLYKLSKSYNISYTRYADDMAFSGDYVPHKIIEVITDIIYDFGFKVNEKKTKLIIGDKQKIVTGISVQGEFLTLPRKTRRLIKQEIHYINTFGLVSHIGKMKIRKPNYLLSLEGKLLFWRQIEPNNEYVLNNLEKISSIKWGL